MSTTVQLELDGAKGTLTYNEQAEGNVRYNLQTEDEKLRKTVKDFMRKEREFNIPESNVIDDYRVDKVKPITNGMYFDLAMCVLQSETQVLVFWPEIPTEGT